MATEKRLIDANDAVSVWEYNLPIIRQMDTNGNMQKYIKLYEEVIDFLKNRPTVDAVEVVHGRWECEHETWGRLQCSNCKKEALLEKSNGDVGTILLYVTSNYCPNCGAKMDGDGDAID